MGEEWGRVWSCQPKKLQNAVSGAQLATRVEVWASRMLRGIWTEMVGFRRWQRTLLRLALEAKPVRFW